jgi:predicted MPP superfamily phosphohydrolase
MRTFQLLFIVIFLIFYSLISIGAIKSLLGITIPANRKKVLRLLIIISAFIFISFVLLYVWPLTTRNTQEYTVHLIFNALLSVDFVFKLPLALSFIIGFFLSINRKHVIYFIGFILSIGFSSSVIYGSLFGTKDLVVNHVELDFLNLPRNYSGFKILQISDIHLGNFLKSKSLMREAQKEASKNNPDIVFFTGDLVNNFSNELEGYSDVFREITKNKESYSILGNHDYGNYSNWKSEADKIANFNKIISAQETFGFKLLDNENIKLKSGLDSIYIIGVENWGHPPFPQYANLEKAMNGIPENSFKILLSHDPAHWEEVIKNRGDIDLTLSGHTHGFQWGIKKAGITFSLSYLARKNWGGLYKYGKSQLYVNTGLGTIGIPWRINMPAELTVITLKRIEID